MLVIDSNVFVSALGKSDEFTYESQKFFKNLKKETKVLVPALAVMETIVAVFKQNPLIVKVIIKYFQGLNIIPLDIQFINLSYTNLPKDIILKSSDLVVALTARIHKATLVTWDKQLLAYAGNICPTTTPIKYIKKRR